MERSHILGEHWQKTSLHPRHPRVSAPSKAKWPSAWTASPKWCCMSVTSTEHERRILVFTDHAGTSSLACMAKHAPARRHWMSSHLRFGSVDEAPQLNLPACVFGYAARCLQSRSDLRSAATSMRLNSDTTPPSVGRASKLLPPPFKNQRTHRSNLQRVSSKLACFLCIRKIAGCPDSSHQGTLRRPSAATPEQELKAPSCRIRAGLLSSVVSSPRTKTMETAKVRRKAVSATL